MKILLASSSYPVSLFETKIVPELEKNPEVHLLFLAKQKEWKKVDWKSAKSRVRLISDKSFEAKKGVDINHASVTPLIHGLLNDSNTFLFSDRISWKLSIRHGVGAVNYFRYVMNLAYGCLEFLERERPDLVYFRTTPHSIFEWVLAHVADELAIPVVINEMAPCPWRHGLYLGYKKERKALPVCEGQPASYEEETNLVENYFNKNRGAYEDALPAYEKKRLSYNGGKYYNFWKDLLKWYKRPDYLYNKYLCFSKYNELTASSRIDQNQVCFFLQYQPERTTLPEGFGYTQQLLAIRALREAIPTNIKIYVKEHPSIFTNRCVPSQRHPSFYDDILKIENVALVPINFDTFELLDNALFIATVSTASVGRQALMRGTPVVYFGRTVFSEGTGIHLYKNRAALESFCLDCVNNGLSTESVQQEVMDQMMGSFQFSVSGIDHSNFDNNIYNVDWRNQAHIKILSLLINGSLTLS